MYNHLTQRFQVGDAVWYRGAWGKEKPVATTITSIGEKRGEPVYGTTLERWGYSNQFEPR